MSLALWEAVQQHPALRTVDKALGHSLQRLDPGVDPLVLVAAVLAAHAVTQGHAGLRLEQAASLLPAEAAADSGAGAGLLPWPAPTHWAGVLRQSRWVHSGGALADTAPAATVLVMEAGLVYLRRYREFERRLAAGLQRIGSAAVESGQLDALAPVFAVLFPAGADDRQARAAAMALRHGLMLVTGGPGTGKTTTIARLLVLLSAQARAAGRGLPRIGLAAPTGRAAERMAESLRQASAAMLAAGIDPALLAALPASGSTVHRLLGVIPESPEFRHNADNPLALDVLVIDEASMMGLPLMTRLVQAVASGTRLVLLGDPDQLPSVDAGDVLAALLRACGDGATVLDDDAAVLQALLGPLPAAQGGLAPPPFAGRRVHLQRGWRQSRALDLAPLAAACRDGDAASALGLLRSATLAGVHWHEDQGDTLAVGRQALIAHAHRVRDAADPARALALANELRVLTAVREGPQGAGPLNARIEALLRTGGDGSPWFHGRLLLVTENSYRHRLFNGDVGVCFDDGSGRVLAWFPGEAEGAPRAFHPATLPAHDSAFAMTVHKAQGSEYGQVWLQLPLRDNRVLSRELVYTGLTRARDGLHVAGSAQVLELALARQAARWTGLDQRLLTAAR